MRQKFLRWIKVHDRMAAGEDAAQEPETSRCVGDSDRAVSRPHDMLVKAEQDKQAGGMDRAVRLTRVDMRIRCAICLNCPGSACRVESPADGSATDSIPIATPWIFPT